jgi:hypothetical protein
MKDYVKYFPGDLVEHLNLGKGVEVSSLEFSVAEIPQRIVYNLGGRAATYFSPGQLRKPGEIGRRVLEAISKDPTLEPAFLETVILPLDTWEITDGGKRLTIEAIKPGPYWSVFVDLSDIYHRSRSIEHTQFFSSLQPVLRERKIGIDLSEYMKTDLAREIVCSRCVYDCNPCPLKRYEK